VQLGKQGSTSATKFETQRAFAFRFCRFGGAESAAAAALLEQEETVQAILLEQVDLVTPAQ
jgi:hypothetical protein